MNIQEIRQKYPQYNDLSDQALIDGFHSKFYSDVPKEDFYKRVGFSQTQQDKSTDELVGDISKQGVFKRGLGGLAGVGEVGLSMISGTPEFITSTAGKLGSYAAAAGQGRLPTAAEKERGAELLTPDIFKDLTYHPKTATGELYNRGVGKAFETAVRAPGAAIEAAIRGTGTTGARENVDNPESIGAGLSQMGLETLMVGQMAVSGAKGIKKFKENKRLREEAALAEKTAREAKLAEEIIQKKTKPEQVPAEGLPVLEDAPPIIPGSEKLGMQAAPEAPRPLPVIPEQLNALVDQGPLGMDVGRVPGGVHDVRTPLPELPPMERGLLSLVDESTAPKLAEDVFSREGGVDFPLRQEVLQQPEISGAIDNFRAQAAELQQVIDNAINPKHREQAAAQLEALQAEFGAGMREMGISNAADAHGLNRGLYEAGVETRRPIEKTFDPKAIAAAAVKKGKISNRKTRNQTGAVDFSLSDRAKKMGDAEFAHMIAGLTGDLNHVKQIMELKSLPPAVKEAMIREATKVAERRKSTTVPEQTSFEGSDVGPSGRKSTTYAPHGAAGDAIPTKGSQIPLGLTSAGKGQRGSIGVPKKNTESFEQWKERVNLPYSDSQLRVAYDEMYPAQSLKAQTENAMSKIPGMDQLSKYDSREVVNDPLGKQSVERMKQHTGNDMATPEGGVKRWFGSAGRMQGWAKNNPIVHEGMQFITSVKEHYKIQTAEAMSGITKAFDKFELNIPGFAKEGWRDAHEVIKLRRQNEMNPDPNFRPENHLSRSQMELWNTIDKTFKDIYEKVNQRRKELNPKAEDLPQLPYYFTSLFVGDWSVPVFDRTTGKFLFNIRETSKFGAKNAAKWIAEQPDFKAGNVALRKHSEFASKRFDQLADFESLFDVLGSQDPMVMEALNRLTNSTNRRAFGTSNMPDRFMNKSGRVGSMGDKPWKSEKDNFYDSKQALRNYVEGANEWLGNTQIGKFLEGMQEIGVDAQGRKAPVIDAPNAKNMIQEYGDYVTGAKENASSLLNRINDWSMNSVGLSGIHSKNFIRNWANVNTALFIGYWSPRAMVQNSYQWAQASVPKMVELSQLEGYSGNISTAVVRGLHEGIMDTIGHWRDRDMMGGNPETRAYKESNHVIDAHLVEQGTLFKNRNANFVYDLISNKSVAMSEQLSRSISFNIYYNFLKDSGVPHEVAMDRAKNLTHETMVNYETYAKPRAFGSTGIAGEMAGRLQTYKMNSVTQLYDYATKMKKENPKTWAPFATSLGLSIISAGVLGMIGMDVAEFMWQALQAADRSVGEQNQWIQENSPKRFIYDTLPDYASMGGLSVLTGANLSGAFAQNLISDSPFKSIFPVFGGAVDQVTAPFRFAGASNDSSRAAALQSVTPSTAKQLIEKTYLTARPDENTRQVVSPHTGNTVWKGEGQGYWGDFTASNVQTLERGKYGLEERNQRGYETDVKEAKKAIEESVEKQAIDFYKATINSESTERPLEKISKKLVEYYEAGGDPNALWTSVEHEFERLGVGDEMIYRLRNDITLATRKELTRAAERVNSR